MSEQVNTLDRTIRNIVAFPVTIFGVLFTPRRVLSEDYESRRCEPGVALALSLTVYFVANRALLKIDSGNVNVDLVPEAALIGHVVVMMAFVLLAQALVLWLVSKRGTVGPEWSRWAHILAYPAAVGFLVSGLVRLASVHSDEGTETLAKMLAHFECLDSQATQMYGSCTGVVDHETAGFVRQASLISFWTASACYIISLCNVVRLSLRAPLGRKVAAVLLALVAAGAVNLVSLALMKRTEDNIEVLSRKQHPTPGVQTPPRSKE